MISRGPWKRCARRAEDALGVIVDADGQMVAALQIYAPEFEENRRAVLLVPELVTFARLVAEGECTGDACETTNPACHPCRARALLNRMEA
jgi:hypothetical protein